MTQTTNDPAKAVARDVGGCPIIHLDVSPALPAGSYSRKADELREASPAFFNSFSPGYWIFTRYEQVRDVYRDPDLFSSESITPWEPEPAYRFIPTQIDRPDHVQYRRILNPWFSPDAVKQVAPTARDLCRRLVEEAAARGSCNFATDFALRFPTEVFLYMLGVPPADADLFVPWVEDFFRGFSGDPAGQEPMLNALAGIRRYWEDALEERRRDASPRERDLPSHLMRATFNDRPLTDIEILDMLVVLTLAGLDTVRASLGYLFVHLAENPGDRRRLIAEPELVPLAVEESLRLYTIIFGDGRKVTRDADFHGCPLQKGDMVYALVSSANRDPREYERAHEFVVDRKGNHHFGFAGGPHRCLGIHLARLEMQIAVEEWLRRIPDFRIATDEPLVERGGGSMTTLLALPLEWEVAP